MTAPVKPEFPSRVLSPDEFEHAGLLSPGQFGEAKFPVVPPPFAPRDATAGVNPKTGKDERANPNAVPLTGLPRILTKYVAGPMLDNPLTTAFTVATPGAAQVMSTLMAKDLTEYVAQKLAEHQLSPEDRARAEADPSRIPGEQAAVEAVMLGAAPLIHAVASRLIGPEAGVPAKATADAFSGRPDGPKGTPSLAAQAVRAQISDILRASQVSPERVRQALSPEDAFRASMAFQEAAHDPKIAPQLQVRAAAIATTLRPDLPPVIPGPRPSASDPWVTDPERVRAAAVKLPNGQVVEGVTHEQAIAHARAAGMVDPHWQPNFDVHDGWSTTHQPFVSREAGYTIAERQGQLRSTNADRALTHNDFTGGGAQNMAGDAMPSGKPLPGGLSDAELAAAGGERFSGLPVSSELRARIGQHMADVKDAFQTILAPASRGAQASEAAGILRATTGEGAARYEQAAFKLDEFRRAIDPLSDADKYAFIDAIEGGQAQPNPEFQAPADAIRTILDDGRKAVQALGTGKLEHFIEDYFPHIWADPEKAATAFEAAAQAKIQAGGKRPMEGGKAFLKERTIPTTAEGLQMGLVPVSTNPVDLTLLKLREMQRYVMAHQSLNEMKDAGLVQFVRSGDKSPDGYTRIQDNIARVFGSREGMVTLPEGANVAPEQVGVIGTRVLGEYWAPEPVARVVNNYLSPGLRGNAIFDAFRGLGNTLNQAQLGLSAFHLMFTSMDASVSRAALGIEYLGSGKPLRGISEILSAPAAPITNMRLGAKIRSAYLNPTNADPDMLALANAVKEAGGRVRMDSFYKNSAPERMIAAWREGEYGKAAALSLPALFETAAKPIMEHIVPLQKLGVFGDLAQKALADLPPEATLVQRRAALASAWDSVDNRMGQLVYDNLFWNKSFKDLSMAAVRSVGWNIGTIRELGGGIVDAATMGTNAMTGNPAVLTHRAAYVMALPITVGFYGALYQYLRTGDGPQELKDYFYPKTGEVDADGNPQRVQIASYMKDFFAYHAHPWETVKHKLSPGLSAVYEMLQNENYYGDQIRNPDDPAVKQIGQEAKFIAEQTLPFSLRGMLESNQRGGQSAVTRFGNWFGITPAPREEVRSAAQNRMAEIQKQKQVSGATPEDAAARQTRREILSAMRGGQGGPDLEKAVTDALDRHQLTPPALVKLLKRAGMTPAQEKFKGLTLGQAIEVFKLANPREQALFADALVKKVSRQVSASRASAP